MGARAQSFDVVMLATPEIDYYADDTRASWQAYCDRHGYCFHCGREHIFKDMHVVWSKIGLLQQQMAQSDADWIVLVDADTLVNRPEFTLEDLIGRYPGKDILIAEDCSRRFGVPIPLGLGGVFKMKTLRPANGGFVVVKNNDLGRRAADSWIGYARGEFAAISDIFPREQMLFWMGVWRDYKPHIAILGDEVMRVGLNPTLDRLTMDLSKAFVLHDKQLPQRPH